MPVRVTSRIEIPDDELEWRFARSGGPGGQHVNTSATKAELRFDVAGSRVLDDAQKQRIAERLGSRLTDDGVLVLQSSEHRSQARNREAAEARLAALLADALRPPRPRHPTKPSRASRQRRLDAKRRRGELKAQRRRPRLP